MNIQVVQENKVVSDEGWIMEIDGNLPPNWEVIYSEGKRQLSLGTELGIGGSSAYFMFVHLSQAFAWKGETHSLTKEDRKRIAANVRRGFRALRHKCKII